MMAQGAGGGGSIKGETGSCRSAAADDDVGLSRDVSPLDFEMGGGGGGGGGSSSTTTSSGVTSSDSVGLEDGLGLQYPFGVPTTTTAGDGWAHGGYQLLGSDSFSTSLGFGGSEMGGSETGLGMEMDGGLGLSLGQGENDFGAFGAEDLRDRDEKTRKIDAEF